MQKHAPNPYGTYRVISPKGVLPQPADVIDNNMEIWDNEVLIDVQTLNIDSASFTEIVKRVLNKKPAEVTTKEEMEAIGNKMKEIVAHAGKHKNPWTGSGGMLLATWLDLEFVQEVIASKRAVETLIPQTDGVLFDANVGIYGQQAIPTVISMLFFWPVLITQIWGLVEQSSLDDRALALAEQAIAVGSTSSASTSSFTSTFTDNHKFCTNCGAKLDGASKFCSNCGTKLG